MPLPSCQNDPPIFCTDKSLHTQSKTVKCQLGYTNREKKPLCENAVHIAHSGPRPPARRAPQSVAVECRCRVTPHSSALPLSDSTITTLHSTQPRNRTQADLGVRIGWVARLECV